jgi:hypothetical protein
MQVDDQCSCQRSDQCYNRTNREIDVSAGEDAQQHAARQNYNIRVLADEVGNIGRGEKGAPPTAADEHLEEKHGSQKNDKHGVLLHRVFDA